ncbi:uncharacterized protein LOC128884848 [Hylaeus volcanicus]|uniref:uncharacterized protein LOC128884848 n=1 Tax=Hylaeus volcanicus TaxID=313075 RepID=UPI0023B8600C|nr:uncharacterized protein LOC128884848 [Hylaeus volcanicus]
MGISDRRKMNATRRMKLICIALVLLNPVNAKTQTSGEYLRNVMIELRDFNVPPPINIYDKHVYNDKNKQNYATQRINMNAQENTGKHRNQSFPHYNILLNDKIHLNRIDSATPSRYYQSYSPSITKMQEPEALGYTRAQLAAMYKNALEKGSTMSLSSLTNALSAVEIPQATDTRVELSGKQPLYQYYFFPLKTFMSEFKKDHGYKTIPAPAFDNTEAAQTTQTQLSNPLFVAISTFVTMAIVFMMSVLFLPKLSQLDILHSRAIQDDFFHLSNIVTNAIERYNHLENYKEHDLDYVR